MLLIETTTLIDGVSRRVTVDADRIIAVIDADADGSSILFHNSATMLVEMPYETFVGAMSEEVS